MQYSENFKGLSALFQSKDPMVAKLSVDKNVPFQTFIEGF